MRKTNSIKRGLSLWSGHVRAILDDKEVEHEAAKEEGEQGEYTDNEMLDLQAAWAWMASQ